MKVEKTEWQRLIASGRTDCVNVIYDFDEEWGMESLVDTYDDNDDNNDIHNGAKNR